MTFLTLDFETASSDRDSACEIGITSVKEGRIISSEAHLIQPPGNYYDSFNIAIHGITPRDTTNAPTLADLWPSLAPQFENQMVVAHNTGFDMSVLRHSLDFHGISHPQFTFCCSYAFSKRRWKGLPGYGLDALCQHFDIELAHHRAGPDSRATAELMMRIIDHSEANNIEQLATELFYSVGIMSPTTYTGCLAKQTSEQRERARAKVVGDPTKHQTNHQFYSSGIVFTGTMSSMTRNDAKKLVADIGATPQSGVSKKTRYLVVGQQDYRRVGEDGMSTKQKKAIELCAEGHEIEVLSEREFLELL